MTELGRDRLRELLDVVLRSTEINDHREPNPLSRMAVDSFVSPFHLTRLLSRSVGEPPVALRRRVLLERAAWQVSQGMSVTDAAWAAGYESLEGFSRAFSRAFGRSPSEPGDSGHWLPAPNGIHFHPPASLWVRAEEAQMSPLTEQLIIHDLDDTGTLIDIAEGLPEAEVVAVRWRGHRVLEDGPEESIAAVLDHLVATKEVWLAAIEGRDGPPSPPAPGASLRERHDTVVPRWLALARDIDRRRGWDDRLIDALCDPPETFVMSGVFAHVLTFSAYRRQVVRRMLVEARCEVDHGDPIMWMRERWSTA